MAHNSFAPGSRTPPAAPSRANLPLLSTSRANVPHFFSKVSTNCEIDEDNDLSIDYFCKEQTNLPFLRASSANVPHFFSKVSSNCGIDDDDDLDIDYFCIEQVPQTGKRIGIHH